MEERREGKENKNCKKTAKECEREVHEIESGMIDLGMVEIEGGKKSAEKKFLIK